MKVIIIGAGLGGLAAAYRLAKSGHDVRVLERSSALTLQGGGMNIRPGGSRILQSWGLGPDMEAISSVTPQTLLRDMTTGDIAMRNIAVDVSEYPDWGLMRQDVIKVLYRNACAVGAQVIFGHQVSDVEDDALGAVVRLVDGTALYADMVLAADGIRSKTRYRALSDLDCPKDPIISNTTFYGISVDDERLAAQPGTLRLMDQVHLNIWMGKDGFAVTRRNPRLRRVELMFGVNSETDQKTLWDEKGDITFVRNFYKDACTELVQALAVAESCDRWILAELPDLPRWTSRAGRVLLLGDSAHAMHPNAAQGFSLIIEDIAVLDYLLLHHHHHHPRDNVDPIVPVVADLWQTIRKPRVERIKAYASWNTAAFSGELQAPSVDIERRNVKSLKDTIPDMNASFHNSRFLKWVLDFDAITETKRFIAKAEAKL